jgi:predicted permease
MLSDILIRLRAVFRPRSAEEDLNEELQFHYEQQAENLAKSGLPLDEARRQARLAIGGMEQIKEECRDARGVRFLEYVMQDVRFGLRSLRKSPGFTVVAILTLTLGIGVNTALFTIVHGVVLNPLPFPQPDRLVNLWERDVLDIGSFNVVSGGVFADWQKQATSFEQLALVGRITQEQVTESLLPTFAGGALGTLLALTTLRWLMSFQADLPRADTIHVDRFALAFTFAITAFCGVIAGLLPSLAVTRNELLCPLKEESRSTAGRKGRARLRKVLLTAEVALTVVLLIGGGLMLKSFQQLRSVNMGCATENVLTMGFTLPDATYPTRPQLAGFLEQLLVRARAVPGVRQAGIVSVLPGAGHFMDNTFEIEGAPPLPQGQFRNAVVRGADPGYFTMMNIPLKQGRFFADSDNREKGNAMVVSESMARKFFPAGDAIGKTLALHWDEMPRFEIVGIVGDVLSDLNQPAEATMYMPINSGRFSYGTLVVRSNRDVTALALPIQKEFAAMDPNVAVSDVLTIEQRIGRSSASAMFDAALVLLFAVLGLVLAAVGLYGLLSYLVTERTNEIGIRMALGAQQSEVMRIMFLDGLRPTGVGLLLGLFAGGVCAQLIRSLLFGVQPLDANIFAAVAAVVLLISIGACTYPAWRAARVDPMTALRCE